MKQDILPDLYAMYVVVRHTDQFPGMVYGIILSNRVMHDFKDGTVLMQFPDASRQQCREIRHGRIYQAVPGK